MSIIDNKLLSELKGIGKKIALLEKRLIAVERSPQMRFTSWTGQQVIYDDTGEPRQVLGAQPDGTYTITEQNGPVPPTPTLPTVESGPGALKIVWDGTYANGERPADMWYVEVHVGFSPGYPKTDATQVHAFQSVNGGDYTYLVDESAGTCYVALIAVTNSMTESVPTAEVVATSLPILLISDGAVPGQVTGVVTDGGIRSVHLAWDTLANADLVTYNVYASILPSVPTTSSYFVGKTTADHMVVYTAWDNANTQMVGLTPGVTYYFTVVAEDYDGFGTASTEVSSTPTQITGPDIAVNSVDTDHLQANSITSELLESEMSITNTLKAGLVTIDGITGITVADPLNPARQTRISASGTGNRFVGQGTFDAADFNDRVNLYGLQNSNNGTMTATQGVTDPTQPPDVTVDYSKQLYGTSPAGSNVGFNRLGMCSSSSGLNWVSTDTVGTISSEIQGWSKTADVGFTIASVLSGWLSIGGVTRISGTFYALCAPSNGSTWTKNGWRVLKYRESDGVYLGSFGCNFTTGGWFPTIGTDGSTLLISWIGPAGFMYCETWDPATTGTGTPLTHTNIPVPLAAHLTSVNKTSTGLSTTRWIVTTTTGIFAYNTSTGARASADEWPRAESNIRGMCVDGGNWHSFHPGRAVDYTLLTGAWDFVYTWYDNDTTGGSTTAETRKSPLNTTAPTKFARWTVSVPTDPPDDGSTDGANTARIYAAVSGSTLYRQTTLTTSPAIGGAPVTLQATYTSLLVSGTAYVNSSGFDSRLSTSAGRFRSAGADGNGPIWDLNGTGHGFAGPLGFTDTRGPTAQLTDGGVISIGTGWTLISADVDVFGLWCQGNIVVQRSGAAITVVDGNGNITNSTIGTLVASIRPTVSLGSYSAGTGRSATYGVATAGNVDLAAVGGPDDIATGDQFSCVIGWFAAA